MKRTLLLGAMLCAMAAMTACKNGHPSNNNTADSLDRETHDALLGEWRAVHYLFYQDTLTDANSNVFIPDDPMHDLSLGDSTIIYRFLPSDTVTILLNSGTEAFCENRLAWSVKGDSICLADADYTTKSHIDTLTADRLVLSYANEQPDRPANVLTLERRGYLQPQAIKPIALRSHEKNQVYDLTANTIRHTRHRGDISTDGYHCHRVGQSNESLRTGEPTAV